MSGWKLFDDGTSAIEIGAPFRVSYFVGCEETFLYFKTRDEAFGFAQRHPNIEKLEIVNLATREVLHGVAT